MVTAINDGVPQVNATIDGMKISPDLKTAFKNAFDNLRKAINSGSDEIEPGAADIVVQFLKDPSLDKYRSQVATQIGDKCEAQLETKIRALIQASGPVGAL